MKFISWHVEPARGVQEFMQEENSYFHSFLLFVAAVIWGCAFVAQSVGMDYVGPLTFLTARSVLSVVALTPAVIHIERKRRQLQTPTERLLTKDALIKGGLICGLCMFAGMVLQQVGLQYTTVGKAGFITTCYVVFVPILGIFLGRRVRLRIWVAVLLTVVGLYLLSMQPGSFYLAKGDAIVLLCAIAYTFHITAVGHFSDRVNGVTFSYAQQVLVMVLGLIVTFIFEEPTLAGLKAAALPIAYAGLLSSCIGYTFQMIGQKGVNPTVASLLLSLESCFSVIGGWLILHETMGSRELFGCALMFVAIVLSQLPENPLRRKKRHSLT